ncbi:MAG: esterase family protein [Candidatus Marinimicrobia bacterium]|nr:esterase family protein [Bacteroidota bacterium]MBL7012996.1 esterase family protein [Candidatus Neomarinimicrobiota bacterium]
MKKNRILLTAVFIILSLNVIYCASSDTIFVYSPSMEKDIPTIVIIPEKYESTPSKLNAVFLLHGYGGDYLNWSNHTDLEERADRFSMILICPDGSPNSWYMDSPIDSSSQYETFMIQTLIPRLKEKYRINQIGITGLSMGGHGSLYLAMRHPEVFTAVSSMSGGVDLTYSTVKWEIASKIGSFELYPERWENHSIVYMVDLIQAGFMPILIDCGYEDFFIDINRALHNRLIERNIPHTYIEKPGGHSWVYWVTALDEHLLFFQNRFE